jgi:hypothetical protein
MQAASQQREGTAFVCIVVHAPAPDPDSDSAAVSAVRVGDVRGGSNVWAQCGRHHGWPAQQRTYRRESGSRGASAGGQPIQPPLSDVCSASDLLATRVGDVRRRPSCVTLARASSFGHWGDTWLGQHACPNRPPTQHIGHSTPALSNPMAGVEQHEPARG